MLNTKKLWIYVFLFTIVVSSQCKNIFNEKSLIKKANESNSYLTSRCGAIKYESKFSDNHDYYSFFDYKQSCQCSKKLKKPTIVFFTAWSISSSLDKIKRYTLEDVDVINFLSENYILTFLYVDDSQRLPKSEIYQSSFFDKPIRTIGGVNVDVQSTRFRFGTQPYVVILDENLELIGEPISDLKDSRLNNKEEFLKWIKESD
jgi:thiol:disulfide interchange protein DsbD